MTAHLEQVPLATLLEDKIYARWIELTPKLEPQPPFKPWRVMFYGDGKWAKREFNKYPKALRFLLDNLHRFEDGVLGCKHKPWRPPVVKRNGHREYYIPGTPGEHPDHRWCGFCRRPTLMAYFSRHHALPHLVVWVKRCTICGYREEGLPRW